MPEHTLLDEPDGYRQVSEALNEKFQISHVTLQVERSLIAKLKIAK